MRVLGIDPSPTFFGWAVYDSARNDIMGWGTMDIQDAPDYNVVVWRTGRFDAVAIENIHGSHFGFSKHEVATAQTIGRLQGLFEGHCPVVLIYRATVAAALGDSRYGDKQINHAMRKLCPRLNRRERGLNDHTRAAAAVAYVGAGRIR